MSFITSNGVLDITLPEGVAADIVMETDNGDFFSDFTITPSDAPDAARWSQVLAGSINGGGVVYRFRTDNGNIFLRRR